VGACKINRGVFARASRILVSSSKIGNAVSMSYLAIGSNQ
jgi:hypothetical protein